MGVHEEEWRPILEVNGVYEVSNMGRVRRKFKKGYKICNPYLDKDGYPRLTLCVNDKRIYRNVHRLVAIAFIPNPNNLPQVNHISEVKTDNRVINLEWSSVVDNVNHGTAIQRRAATQGTSIVNTKTGERFESIADAARHYGLNRRTLSSWLSGEYKSREEIHRHWKYEEEAIDNGEI